MTSKHPTTLQDARAAFRQMPELTLTPRAAFINERVSKIVHDLMEQPNPVLEALQEHAPDLATPIDQADELPCLPSLELDLFELIQDGVWEGYMAAFHDSRLTLAELLS